MVRLTSGLLLCAACALAAPPDAPWTHGDHQQAIIGRPSASKSQPAPRKLQGRFLHITDFHPDPFYKLHSATSQQCHFGKGRAGIYGAEVTDCDTPISLVNATFKWIDEHLKDQIDFVVWTGDSARHDNDERLPRSDKQVLKLNRFLVDKFVEVFGKPDNIDDPDPTNDFVVPIVPTFGNNDILPHNIFLPGPNKWTREYLDVWNRFVPQAQRHSFARGGWFFTEVIPNKLAVFSLNTLYFFDSNSAVDGCDLKSEPGYEHMEWLRIQLQFLRNRGMKAILIGHVPPARTSSKQNWDETCYQKYTLWLRQYRDVIITSVFGHMNIDHFMFQDVKELKYRFKIKGVDDEFTRGSEFRPRSNSEAFSIAAKAQYLNELRSGWSELPKPPPGYNSSLMESSEDSSSVVEIEKKKKKKKKKPNEEKEIEKFLKAIGGPWGERFSMTLVSPSVVPNFFPTLRVVEYNITGMMDHHPARGAIGEPACESDLVDYDTDEEETALSHELWDEPTDCNEESSDDLHDLKKKKKKGKKGKKKRPKKPNFAVPKPPSSTSPPGPAYSPQPLSLISWTQYYANLTEIHDAIDGDKGGHKHPEKFFKYDIEYMINNDSMYQLKDLTMRSMLDFAERMGRADLPRLDDARSGDPDGDGEEEVFDGHKAEIGTTKKESDKKRKKAKNHLWKLFVKRVFVLTKPDEDIDQDFG